MFNAAIGQLPKILTLMFIQGMAKLNLINN